jgi:hypothetical protein
MAKPHMARSAKIAERNLDPTQVPEQSGPQESQLVHERRKRGFIHYHGELQVDNSLLNVGAHDQLACRTEKSSHLRLLVSFIAVGTSGFPFLTHGKA